jgi:hypothetical protein
VTHFDENIEKQLRRIVREEGITSFKLTWPTKAPTASAMTTSFKRSAWRTN